MALRGHLVQYPHVTDGQTEVQKGEVTEPNSHSELLTKLKSEMEFLYIYVYIFIYIHIYTYISVLKR